MPFNDTVAVAGSRSVCWRRLCFMGLVEACPFGKSGLLEGELKRGASIVLRHLLSGVAGSSPVFLKKRRGQREKRRFFQLIMHSDCSVFLLLETGLLVLKCLIFRLKCSSSLLVSAQLFLRMYLHKPKCCAIFVNVIGRETNSRSLLTKKGAK